MNATLSFHPQDRNVKMLLMSGIVEKSEAGQPLCIDNFLGLGGGGGGGGGAQA